MASGKIAVDETVAPVLDPGRGRAKKGYFWAIPRVIAAAKTLDVEALDKQHLGLSMQMQPTALARIHASMPMFWVISVSRVARIMSGSTTFPNQY